MSMTHNPPSRDPAPFRAWQAKVNQIIDRLAGLDADDLPDQPYYDWFLAGLSPAVAAHEALTESGWADEYDEDDEGEYE